MKHRTSSYEELGKGELLALCDRLLSCDPDAIEMSIAFIEADTFGIWHGRARAKMARRLKHCRLSQAQQTRIISAVLDRLVNGRFSEQFKDQLRLALQLAPERVYTIARSCQGATAEHVRRYAAWVLSHDLQSR